MSATKRAPGTGAPNISDTGTFYPFRVPARYTPKPSARLRFLERGINRWFNVERSLRIDAAIVEREEELDWLAWFYTEPQPN